MATINKPKAVRTHEGAKGRAFGPEQELRRALMNCMLWEDQFYEDGVSIAERIGALVPAGRRRSGRGDGDRGARGYEAAPCAASDRARDGAPRRPQGASRQHARTHHPAAGRADRIPRDLLGRCARADAAAQEARRIGAGQEGPGARALPSSMPTSLPNTTATAPVRLRDVLFLVHAKPKDKKQEKIWKAAGRRDARDARYLGGGAFGRRRQEGCVRAA